jgi:hypothetical protein
MVTFHRYHSAMAITQVTRQAIIDELLVGKIWWWGRQNEVSFLNRLYRLSELPSYDGRYADAAGDIHQHCVNNDDWPSDWVFTDPRFELATDDEKFLRFLAATVHPVVRPEKSEAQTIVEMYNRHLAPDGWELAEEAQISGRSVYAGRSRLTVPAALKHVEHTVTAGDKDYLTTQITRMEAAIETDPELAIGTAKELVETACKTVLLALGVTPDKDWNLAKLVNETGKMLKVTPADVSESAPAADSIRKVLGSLGGIVSGIAELRNTYGTGHGKELGQGGLGPRHARLAVGAASTLAAFLFETYDQRSGANS